LVGFSLGISSLNGTKKLRPWHRPRARIQRQSHDLSQALGASEKLRPVSVPFCPLGHDIPKDVLCGEVKQDI